MQTSGSQIMTGKTRKMKTRIISKEIRRHSPKKFQSSTEKASRNAAKTYSSSQVVSPALASQRAVLCKSTPKKIGRRNAASKLSHTHRSTYFTKKSNKSGKSASKNKEQNLSPQQTLIDFLLNSTNNPVSFAKDFDHGHAKSQFTYQLNRTQGTTRGTMSPQSTNFGNKIFGSNQKLVAEFKKTWGEA
jgi:hypothetical protein